MVQWLFGRLRGTCFLVAIALALALAIAGLWRWYTWCPASSHALVRSFRVRGSVQAGAISSLAKVIALCPEGGTSVTLLDYGSGTVRRVRLTQRTGSLWESSLGVALSADGRLAVVSMGLGGLAVVDVAGGREDHLYQPAPHDTMRRPGAELTLDISGSFARLGGGTGAIDLRNGQVWRIESRPGAAHGAKARLREVHGRWPDLHGSSLRSDAEPLADVEWCSTMHEQYEESAPVATAAAPRGRPPSPVERGMTGALEHLWLGPERRLVVVSPVTPTPGSSHVGVVDIATDKQWPLEVVEWNGIVLLDETDGLVVLAERKGVIGGACLPARVWVIELPGFRQASD